MDSRRPVNKKANLPIVILVIGIFALCSLALLSFISFSLTLGDSFDSQINLIEKANSDIEEKNLSNYFDEKTEPGRWPWFLDKFVISIKYNSP